MNKKTLLDLSGMSENAKPYVPTERERALTHAAANDALVISQFRADLQTAVDYISKLEQQRDAAVAALREAVRSLEWAKLIIRDIPEKSGYNDTLAQARAAIAQIEKGQ